ncbi:MAG: hypothetical protein SO445_08065 [Lachnospiraceae bacterium]|nr:hypothetical protein [Lachnospiraceae bacterium]MDD7378278.1 hypothetical protein [Lachnospiraceae bacterium]MDY4617647.1 hypothetical protein [Lachnospiraceae bacterium]
MATEMISDVYIENETGNDIIGITVEHIYGDREPETIGGSLFNGNILLDSKEVIIGCANYEVGAFTGLDWWRITWTDSNGNIYSSDQELLSKIGAYCGQYFMDIISLTSSSIALWATVTDQKKWIANMVNLITVFFNFATRSLTGGLSKGQHFKEFMLRKSDNSIRFILKSNNEIDIVASSGESTVKYYQKQIKQPVMLP